MIIRDEIFDCCFTIRLLKQNEIFKEGWRRNYLSLGVKNTNDQSLVVANHMPPNEEQN